MAATRIWSIKGRIDNVINYVTNPEKTDGQQIYRHGASSFDGCNRLCRRRGKDA